MMVYSRLEPGTKPTPEQIAEIRESSEEDLVWAVRGRDRRLRLKEQCGA